jgi:hypothetical protein
VATRLSPFTSHSLQWCPLLSSPGCGRCWFPCGRSRIYGQRGGIAGWRKGRLWRKSAQDMLALMTRIRFRVETRSAVDLHGSETIGQLLASIRQNFQENQQNWRTIAYGIRPTCGDAPADSSPVAESLKDCGGPIHHRRSRDETLGVMNFLL